ncbi:MAG: nuclear transport factor 2 family protein [Pseudomonas sp.]|uniref:nuclear transport factor 2 family protein n=1 Tax=Pseudomonas sp. TaxID=306 RepID=UPI003981EA18
MNLQLPEAVETYFEISNNGDVSRLAACFSANATVIDENRTHQGIEAIKAWQTEARQTFTYRVEPLEASQAQGKLSVITRVTGNFPRSPVKLNQLFLLQDGLIHSLEITP